VHTCDERHGRAWIAARNPSWTFEDGFAERDELWTADVRESAGEQQARIHAALVKILDNDASTCEWGAAGALRLLMCGLDISITAHSGTVAAALRAVGHRPFTLATGG
jgi:hypothetical protein